MKHRTLGLFGLVLSANLTWTYLARADIAPPLERPADWDEYPEPMPEVPLEDALARRLALLLILGAVGYSLVATARRRQIARKRIVP